MKRSIPLSKLSEDEIRDPKNRRAVMRRGAYLRRVRAGLAVSAPLPGFELEDAVQEIRFWEDDRKYCRARLRDASRGGPALRQRMHRLRKLAPTGVTLDVWAEIVAHFRGACHVEKCPAMACRVGRLVDGTPVPACRVHGVEA